MIYQKLLKIQQAVDKFVQDGKGQNYSYTTGSTVLNKIRPLMNEQGLILKQEVVSLINTRQDYIVGAGSDRERTKSEILSCVMQRFTWVDSETGETDVNEFAANGMNDWDKGFGSALTYAERYFLLKYFHVPTDEDDPDHGKPTKPEPVKSDIPAKPWLNKGTPEFAKAKEFVSKATDKAAALKALRVNAAISKETESLLLA